MSDAKEPATTTADCGDPATRIEPQPEATKLCMFAAPMSAADTFERTARYARDPKQYLIDQLGQEAFDAKKELMLVPETVDKDAYGTGTHKAGFENGLAGFFGKKAGLFFITGVQAQLAAVKIHCDRSGNQRVAWHESCHLESAEERAYETLYHLDRTLLGSDPDKLPTVPEIRNVLELPTEQRPAAIVLEVPNRVLGCQTYTFNDLTAISSACRAANVKLHCDGARIWEIEPYYQLTFGKCFKDLAALFDTIYVSFYKGLGGISGAMLMSDDDSLITEAKMWQRRAGGNAFTLAYEVVDCERGFNENIGTFGRKREKMLEVSGAIKEATANFKNGSGQPIVQFFPETPICCQTRTFFDGFTEQQLYAARDRAQEKTGIRVFERIWPKFSLDEKMAANRAGVSDEDFSKRFPDTKRHVIEWMMMNVTEKIETKTFVDGYVAMCEELVR